MVDGDAAEMDVGMAAPSIRGGLNPEASRLFRAYRTISNMLSKRGYMIPKEMREMTPVTFKQRFGETPSRESLTILVVGYFYYSILEELGVEQQGTCAAISCGHCQKQARCYLVWSSYHVSLCFT